MGLDMYLLKKSKKDSRKASDVWSEAGYWRKANQVHRFFVENVQNGVDDCEEYEVTKEVLEDLKERCEKILKEVVTKKGQIEVGRRYEKGKEEIIFEEGDIVMNPQICDELLPSQSGFFFGSTSYDNFYLQGLRDTIKICNDTLQNVDFENEQIFYHSSW